MKKEIYFIISCILIIAATIATIYSILIDYTPPLWTSLAVEIGWGVIVINIIISTYLLLKDNLD